MMKSRLTRVALFAALATALPGMVIAEDNTPPEGFVALFNGHDFEGWSGRPHLDPAAFNRFSDAERGEKQAAWNNDLAAHWKVEDGVIINDGHGVFCTTDKDFGDFELFVDWMMVSPGTDSGIYLRGCPQVQIWDPNHEPQWKNGSNLGSGGLWNNNPGTAGKDPLVKADQPVGEWNTLRIIARGSRVTVWLNEKLVVDDAEMHNYFDRQQPLYAKGPIQLQTHGGEMRFRNIFVRELQP